MLVIGLMRGIIGLCLRRFIVISLSEFVLLREVGNELLMNDSILPALAFSLDM